MTMADMTAIPHPLVLPRLSRRAAFWLAAVAIWTLLGLLSALQAAVYAAYTGEVVEWQRILPLRLADWYTCAVFTPLCFWLVRSGRGIATQLAFIAGSVVLKYAMYVELLRLIRPAETWHFGRILARSFATESIAFAALLAVVHGIEYHRRYRERELHAARLEAELASARLDALSAQLQPHFLFNTLNSISTLMRRDADAAEEMLAHLGDLLRRTLRARDGHEVTLAEELELLQHYLDIMKIRFQDRLVIKLAIDADVGGALVPHLVLQPVVENAIQHGIARKAGAGLLEVSARRDGEALEISVRDDGDSGAVAAPGRRAEGIGIGLSNTRRRLRELYGDAQSLALATAEEGGLRVTLRLPLRTR
jgi:two-component system LytT family sensor kinase